jgi:hypothetical protein
MRQLGLILVILAFLAGAFLTVLDPLTVDWAWFVPVLALGAVGLWLHRKAHRAAARAGDKVAGNMETLGRALDRIVVNLRELRERRDSLPVYEARFEIDRLFRADLNDFADARETMHHVFGMQGYADVMSAFAAGERYVNRVWSASTDGYEDEVRAYIERAADQFREAQDLFQRLLESNRNPQEAA